MLGLALAATEPATLARPVIVAPAPREVSFGVVRGRVSDGTVRIVVKVGQTTAVDVPVSDTHFRFELSLPPRDLAIHVTAFDATGNSVTSTVTPVFGLPRKAYPTAIISTLDTYLSGQIRSLVREFPGTAAVFVQDLRTGRGAAWNARARFQAASTLKLGIAIELLRVLGRPPAQGTYLAGRFWKMLVYSDNKAANDLMGWLGRGSVDAGALRVNATLEALGLRDTHMRGGYILGTATTRPIPLRVESQPPYFPGWKHSSAWDMARIHGFVHRAAAGQGPLLRLAGHFSPADGRYMLWVLAHVADPGKIDRYIRTRSDVAVLHKAGWILHARHDTALVFWREGVFVITVMTWHPVEAGSSSDILAGRIARIALRRFENTPPPSTRAWRLPS
jgi:hypothetical protein